jgi:hypothetical protein
MLLTKNRDATNAHAVGDALSPFFGAREVHAGSFAVNGDGYGHVHDYELVDGFHAEVFKGQQA